MDQTVPKKASCVAAFNPENGEVLAVSRRGEPDQWVLPGGKEDEGETAVQCAMREFFEETGVRLQDEPVLFQQGLDNAGYLNSTYLVVSSRDLLSILLEYNGVSKEIEKGIIVCYQPFGKLLAGPFAQSNEQVLDKLLAIVCRKLIMPTMNRDESGDESAAGAENHQANEPVPDGARQYEPSTLLRSIVLKAWLDMSPNHRITETVITRLDAEIENSVRGFISTIGLALDADQNDTYALTQGGVMKDEIVEGYAYRLPPRPEDAKQLALAITKDLYRYAGHPIMEMASAKLVVRDGELVVVGLESKKKPAPSTRVRATIAPLG